jgi:hypothetical protein
MEKGFARRRNWFPKNSSFPKNEPFVSVNNKKIIRKRISRLILINAN